MTTREGGSARVDARREGRAQPAPNSMTISAILERQRKDIADRADAPVLPVSGTSPLSKRSASRRDGENR